jgi:starch-binding outer membrane protein, SusD/RagB family
MYKTFYKGKGLFGLIIFIQILLFPGACKKFVTASVPLTQISTAAVYSNDATAQSAITGIYSQMMNSVSDFASGGSAGLGLLCGLSADEFDNYSVSIDQVGFSGNSILPQNGILTGSLWGPAYQYIYDANLALGGLASSKNISSATKNRLEGEALFIRAFSYFYLVNLFGDVPLITGTDYTTNKSASRTPAVQVYRQIVSDLLQAIALLPEDYAVSNGEKVRPNKWAAMALLARVYLFAGDWQDAATMSSQLISNPSFALETDPGQVFLANSNETIWQLMPVTQGYETWDAYFFILTTTPRWVALSGNLLSVFEPGDLRKTNWVDSIVVAGKVYYYPYKYKNNASGGTNPPEYQMVLRLAEQYLIRAEAEARLNQTGPSLADLNTIRNRAGLAPSQAQDPETLIAAIARERRVEFFSEWGHRWLDLKRTGAAGSVLRTLKPLWHDTDTLYPLPEPEIKADPMLVQNPGY